MPTAFNILTIIHTANTANTIKTTQVSAGENISSLIIITEKGNKITIGSADQITIVKVSL
jgi:hypothetical protein